MIARTLVIIGLLMPFAAAARAAQQVREHDAAWSAPARAAARTNPLAARMHLVAGGDKVFHERCETCHAADGHGTDKAPDLTQPSVQIQTDGELYWKISTGNAHAGMPAFSFLPAAQRWQLVLYLRTVAQAPRP